MIFGWDHKEWRKEYSRIYYKHYKDWIIERHRIWRKHNKKHLLEYRSRPEVRKRELERMKRDRKLNPLKYSIYGKRSYIKNRNRALAWEEEYRSRPEIRQKKMEYAREYRKRTGYDKKHYWETRERQLARVKEQRSRPEVKARIKSYNKIHYLINKISKLNSKEGIKG